MISEKQMKILAFPYTDYDMLICDGAVRSGKTSLMTVAFVDWAMREFNGCQFALCGKTVGSVIRNIVTPYMALSYAKERYKMSFNRAENKLTVRRGNIENFFYLYGGKDESSYMLIQGITLAGILVDEVALLVRSFVEQAMARCSVEGAKMLFNCNPDSPNHWFYRNFIDTTTEEYRQMKDKDGLKICHLHFLMRDNPSLSEKTLKRYEAMYSGVFYERYILGKWVIASGLIYNFDESKNLVEAEIQGDNIIINGQPKQRTGYFYLACDYGITNPFVCQLWYVEYQNAICLDEYYYYSEEHRGVRRTDDEHYQGIEKLIQGIPIEYIVIDPSASSMIELIKRKGNLYVRVADNDVKGGIGHMGAYLNQGYIKYTRKCEHTIKEFSLYVWDEKATEDKPVKENDHCLTGDTLVWTEKGNIPIKELCGQIGKLWTVQNGKPALKAFKDCRKTRKKTRIIKITFEDGNVLKCTPDHLILTETGYKEARYLTETDKIIAICN